MIQWASLPKFQGYLRLQRGGRAADRMYLLFAVADLENSRGVFSVHQYSQPHQLVLILARFHFATVRAEAHGESRVKTLLRRKLLVVPL